MKRESYDVLGVRRNASENEIKAAYRRLARQYHPDVSGDTPEAAERFREINEAYQRLSEPARRRAGAGVFDGADFRGGSFSFTEIFGETGLAELFGMGAEETSGWWPEPEPGGDVVIELAIPLEDALTGGTRSVTVRALRRCEACSGRGSLDGRVTACGPCSGSGTVYSERPDGGELFRERTDCPACRGRGVVFDNPCLACHGGGRVGGNRRVDIDFPPGAPDEIPILLRGRGHDGDHGGVAGDLYIVLKLASHTYFEPRDDDLYSEANISLQQAIFGGTVAVQTIDGPRKVRIRPGAQSHGLYRLRGFGLPRREGEGRGDQLVRLSVKLPGGLEGEKAELLRDLLNLIDDVDISGAD